MPHKAKYDVVVIGSGPNGLAAALVAARAGLSVLVLEACQTIGGGLRTDQLTLSGFLHDICSAIHPFARCSPFFRRANLERQGLELITPAVSLAHPFDDGTAAIIEKSLDTTAEKLDVDKQAYLRLFGPLVENWQPLMDEIMRPLRLPRHPLLLARFGYNALRSARGLVESLFQTTKARSVFCGVAAHGLLPLERIITASFGIVLIVLAHANGWLVPRGGSVRIALALESEIRSLGGKILTGNAVRSIKDIPEAKAILFDLTPRQILDICGDRLPSGYRKQLQRYRYGPGAFKIDWALSEPIPFKAPVCRLASTVHLCGNYDEISESERSVWRGLPSERPFVLLTQPSIFDPTRAPQGKHTAWAYCHVPANSRVDMTQAIENQVERFAPGFRDIILARHVLSPYDLEKYNENYVGGEINGGVQDLRQLFTRPTLSLTPYRMPVRGLYICSSSTPPGGGVHGMCGYHAAKTALKDLFNLDAEEIKWPD